MDVRFETLNGNSAGTHEWLTPPYIIESLGKFDLDPCSPIDRPWDTATNHFTEKDDGLSKDWHGRVWCNPPYGDFAKHWLKKCASHGDAIALIFARTETKMFFESIWNLADSVLFIKGRLSFYTPSGVKGGSAGAASVLVAYGENNSKILQSCGIEGKFVNLKCQ